MHGPILIGMLVGAIETLPVVYYGRSLAALEPARAISSFTASFLGTTAMYLLLMSLAARRRRSRALAIAGIVVASLLFQAVHFGIYREFSALPTVSVADFARQNWRYAGALFLGRVDALSAALLLVACAVLASLVRRGVAGVSGSRAAALCGLGLVMVASRAVTRAPFMSVSEHAIWLVAESIRGPGQINAAWTPERARPSKTPARYPMNVILFRLEEVAAQATTLARPELPTTPFLQSLLDEHPSETFVATLHFANATATDVSVLSIYTGLAPAAPLDAHRSVPTLWDYFAAAGFDTSLFLPDHLEWGDFRQRFQARPGELNLRKVVDAGNAGAPLVYDHSLNDSAVVDAALEYQRQRGWAEPFLQIVSLRMPHAVGEGARVNRLDHGPWPAEPPELHDYYNGIRHDDGLMQGFIAALPDAVRRRTALVFVSDHGTRLFGRNAGAGELHRLDNYHVETTRVPWLIHVPRAARGSDPGKGLDQLRSNLEAHATSNIDVLPTLLGLVGIEPVDVGMASSELLLGRDLTAPIAATRGIVQLNTGPLRRWDREHFGLVLEDGAFHYLFGRDGERLFDLRQDPLEQADLAADAAFAPMLVRARALAAELPELRRIQQKYARAEAVTIAVDPPNGVASLLSARSGHEGTVRLAAGEPRRLLGEYVISPAHGPVRVTFQARALQGAGSLEWRLRSASDRTHFGHPEGLEEGDVHRFEFHWRPHDAAMAALSVQLFGSSEAIPFSLRIERAAATRVADGRAASERPELAIVALERHVASAPASAVYPVGRFTQHDCLSAPGVAACPSGFLSWGPYVSGRRGEQVRLRYDIEARRAGARVWFDVAARQGSDEIARSRVFDIDEPGIHSFALAARLLADVDAIEGRMNADGGASLPSDALAVRDAELRLLP